MKASLTVMPGDIVNVEVYAKYIDPNTANWNTALTNLIAAIANNTGGIVSTGENYDASTGSFPYANMSGATGTEGSAPKAYLNWLIFDQDFNLLDAGFDRISESARETGTDAPHDRLHNAAPITIDQPGYVYIYLSNENGDLVEVFFDDFSVEHIHGEVVQVDDYYPFGLAFNSYGRESSVTQDFKFNGKEEQTELGLGWLDFGARMYMSDIGRWGVVDPLSEKGRRWSSYTYAFDNPVRFIDPEGMWPDDLVKRLIQAGKDYVVNKAKEAVVNTVAAVVHEAKEFAEDIEVSLYAKAEVKTSQGDRLTGVKYRSIGMDLNHGSNTERRETFEISTSNGFQRESFTQSENKTETTTGGSVGGPVAELGPVVIVANASYNTTVETENGDVIREKVESSGNVSVNGSDRGLFITHTRETTDRATTNELTVAPVTGGFSIGFQKTFDANYSIGIRLRHTNDDE